MLIISSQQDDLCHMQEAIGNFSSKRAQALREGHACERKEALRGDVESLRVRLEGESRKALERAAEGERLRSEKAAALVSGEGSSR